MDQRVGFESSALKQSISETEYLSFLINHAVDNQYAVAVWRLPNDETRHLIISRHHIHLNTEATLEDLPSGFIFAPFEPVSDRIFLKADLSFSFADKRLMTPATLLESSSQEWLQTELMNGVKEATRFYTLDNPVSSEPLSFFTTIKTALAEIQKGTFEKIVPSRSIELDLSPRFDVVQAFQELCDANPNALISFVSTAESGSWIGASPELLVCVKDKSIFKTIALAGTQPYQGQDLRAVAWTQKDIEEQALVERYIISCFKMIRLREYEEHGPKTVVAGNLLHLKSEFQVDMKATNFPQLGSVMLKLLHPTAAVCGAPLQTSLEFLARHEGYNRQYYTGYLGPVNFNGDIEIFVNLRCAQLVNNKAIIYAGAGVTADSIPEQEWIETDMKMNTLRDVLSKR